ncbi:MAG TPA: hypothetical protein VNJ01_03510, partial [Bacteriovoracaceae bacterium]|nr:hypothetical protein [Bacteriovoracaceae bacterium]
PASGTTSYTLTFPPAVGSANQVLTTNASGVLSWTTIGTATAVGGDLTGTIASATIAADAVTSGKILDGTLVDADINATAAIAQSKIANLTTDLTTINTNVSGKIGLTALSATAPLAYNNATGAFTVSAATGTAAGTMSAADKTKLDAVTTTELGYVSGVTSALQGQIDSKFDKAGGTLTGNLIVNTELQLKDGATSNYVTLKAPATGTTSYTLTFPAAVGSANQVLTTNASGVLTWTTIGTATSVGGDLTGTVANATIATSSVTSGKVLDGTLVDADINASAAIAQSKIANLTTDLTTINTNVAGKIGLTALSATGPLAYNNTTGAFTVSAASGTAAGTMSSADKAKLDSVTSTELGYVAGVTSALQGQLDAKLAKAGGSMTGDLTLETQLNLKDGASANYVNLRAPASGTTTYTLTFPPSVGSANQVLTTSASGVLSWTTIGTATSVGGDLTGTVANATIAASSVTSGKVLDGTLVDADVNASAAIAQSKINNLTTDLSTITTNVAGKIGLTALSATAPLTYNNTTGAFTVSAATGSAAGTLSAADKTKLDSVTATELGYVSGVTSALQGQIDAKFDKAGGTLTGNLLVNTQLQLKDGAVANYVTLKAPASGTTSYTLTFPGTVGSANQVLTTDASGVLSWTTIGTSTSVGGDLTGTVANSTIATSAVTSGKVLDGTLVDADINATAAIAQSKVANLTTDLAGKIGLTALSASAPLVYTNTTGAFSITAATISAAGSMSSADKTKMDALEILSSGNGLFERFSGVISSNTCAAGEVLSWNAVTGWDCTIVVNSLLGTVTPSNVVIANGDTIAAAFDKTQGQIAVKANIASPTFTGIPAAPTATAGTNTTQVATTAFVDAAVQKYVVLSGVDVVNITVNTMANVTGLSFPVTAGVTYEFEFFIVYTSATANGSRWSISGPASTFLHYDSQYSFTTTTQSLNPGLSGYDLPIGVNATSAYATSNIASIKGVINASVTGSVIARFASETISGVTAKAGRSYVKYRAL